MRLSDSEKNIIKRSAQVELEWLKKLLGTGDKRVMQKPNRTTLFWIAKMMV